MDEPGIGRQYYLNNIGNIYDCWEQYRGDGVTIAVIDGGFNPDHEDFTFEDGTSKVTSTSGGFTTTGSQTSFQQGKQYATDLGDSHGSFCAGVAAAGINGKGVVGVAPNASLMLLKTDKKPKSIVAAFKYAADNGAKVITISIGSYYNYNGDLIDDGSDLSTVFDSAVSYCKTKGTVVVSAGGNGGLDHQPNEYTFPGATTGVIGVGGLAANSEGEIWEGSSYNSAPQYQFCDVFAPADMMYGCCHYDGKKYDGGWNGTSFASPQVAGLAALYFQKNPSATPAQFESALYASCHKITTSEIATASQLGYGRIDAAKLLGITSSGEVSVKASASWSSCYCYAYDLVTGKENAPWPGVAMSKSGGTFTTSVDSSKYSKIVLAQSGSGSKSVDLSLSSFRDGHKYTLGTYKEVGAIVGSYSK